MSVEWAAGIPQDRGLQYIPTTPVRLKHGRVQLQGQVCQRRRERKREREIWSLSGRLKKRFVLQQLEFQTDVIFKKDVVDLCSIQLASLIQLLK